MATKFPMYGEWWFKIQSITGADVSQFLKAKHQNKDLSRGEEEMAERWLVWSPQVHATIYNMWR